MGRVVANSNVDDSKTVEDLASKCEIFFNDLIGQLHGNIEFDKNILSQTVTVTFPASANTEIAVAHSLNRIAQGYIVCGKSVACDIYDGASSFTNKNIYLKCTVASAVVKIIIKGS